MNKKFLTMLLALVLIVCAIPFAASAAEVEYAGPTCEASPFGHKWENGSCRACALPCNHSFDATGECSNCGYVCEHNYQMDVCTICGAACPHDYKWTGVYTQDPTCTEKGVGVFECEICGAPENMQVDALGHSEVKIPATEPTCTKSARTEGVRCDRCNVTLVEPEIVYGTYLNHSYDEGTVTKEATCAEEGVLTYQCTRDNCDHSETVTINKIAHNVVLVETITDPTCSVEGKGHYDCTGCGYAYDAAIPVIDHEYVVWEGYAATCTETGRTDGEWCKYCTSNSIKTPRQEIPALEHVIKLDFASSEPTCTKKGWGRYVCEREGCTHSYTDWIPVIDHEYVVWEGYAATCTETGRTDGEWCKHCTSNSIKTPRQEIPALEHSMKLTTTYRDATCTEEGWGKYECEREGCSHNTTAAIPVIDHEYVVWEGRPATCTETGRTDGEWCKYCTSNSIKTPRQEIPALEHVIKLDFASTEPTCTAKGWGKYVCEREGCNYEYTDFVPMIDHKYVVWEGYPATCTATGRTDGEWCEYCTSNSIKTPRQEIPALEHVMVLSDFVSTEPTCTEKGWGRYVCDREGCDYYEGGWIDALGHDFVEQESWAATCTKDGCVEKQCSRCKLTTITRTDAAGHNWTDVAEHKASCVETGYSAHKLCTVCSETEGKVEIGLQDHTWKTMPAQEATCAVDGHTEYEQCEICEEIRGKETVKAAHTFENFKCKDCGAPDPACKHPQDKVTFNHKDSTCTVAGVDGWKCNICGEESEKTLPLADHKIEVKVTAATCTAKGSTVEFCTVCKQNVRKIETPMVGHNYVEGKCACGASDPDYVAPSEPTTPSEPVETGCKHAHVSTFTQPATCLTPGYKLVTCSACEAVVTRETIPAKGHTVKTATQPATCTQNGARTETCEICNAFISHTVLPAKGHRYNDGICSACGEADPNRYTTDFQDVFLVG